MTEHPEDEEARREYAAALETGDARRVEDARQAVYDASRASWLARSAKREPIGA